MRLPGQDGPGNLINRKNRFFYIEAIPKLFSQLRKKYIFFAIEFFFEKKYRKKKSEKKIEKSETKNPRFFKISNVEILKFEILKNSRGFFEFFSDFFRHFFSEKINRDFFFRSCEKILGITSM